MASLIDFLSQPSTSDVRRGLMGMVVNRGDILPLGTYGDGSTRMAWPKPLAPIADLAKSFMYGTPPPDVNEAGSAIAGLATLGSIPFASRGALASAGGKLTQPQGIKAYHGSPHDFDRFSLEHIGKGEGAQAYGHGLYFAESRDVAKSYQDALTTNWSANQNIHPETAYALKHSNNDAVAAAAYARRMAEEQSWAPLAVAEWLKAAEALEAGTAKPNSGRLYEVSIKADPADFLDWDKPLSQQSERIRKTMTDLANGEILPDWNGMQAYRSVGSQMMSNLDLESPELAKRLKDAGIPGLRYLDQGSRTGLGEGTSNYVVFDDSLIEILRKYGLLGMIGSGAIAANQIQQPGREY